MDEIEELRQENTSLKFILGAILYFKGAVHVSHYLMRHLPSNLQIVQNDLGDGVVFHARIPEDRVEEEKT